jgi:tetratricopeptide (TPR) repeat protein
MELVRGRSLKAWLAETQRSATEIVDVYVHAGRGLAAAHDAGLVHRDFKPGNAMVDAAGRVRVLDFGLARPVVPPHADSVGRPTDHAASESSEVTEVGFVAGTPAYMAPEQMDGRADDRSDQFAFCVALWEALFGARPYTRDSRHARSTATPEGPPEPPRPGVPPRVVKALRRGLAFAPEARWPSMHALLSRLQRPGARRRRGPAIVVLGVVAALSAWVGWPARDPCDDVDAPMRAAWSPHVRAEVERAILATAHPLALDAWTRMATELDAYAEAWIEQRRTACRTEAAADEVVACLELRRHRFESIVALLREGEPDLVEHGLDAVRGLPAVDACPESSSPAPSDPALARRAARLSTLVDAGRFAAALDEGVPLLAEARTLGDPVLTADAAIAVGHSLQELGRFDEAGAHFEDAFFVASDAGLAQSAAIAACAHVVLLAGWPTTLADPQVWVRHAEVAVERAGRPAGLELGLERTLLKLTVARGDRPAALAHARRALALSERNDDADDSGLAESKYELAVALQEAGQAEEALQLQQEALVAMEAAYGAAHPQLGSVHNGLANALSMLGREDEALEHYRIAIGIFEGSLRPEHPLVAMMYYNIGRLHQLRGRFGEAERAYLRAVELLEAEVGADHVRTAMPLSNLGVLYAERKDHERAIVYLQRALAVFESSDVDPFYVAMAQFSLARSLWAIDRDRPRALALARQARPVFERAGHLGEEPRRELETWLERVAGPGGREADAARSAARPDR